MAIWDCKGKLISGTGICDGHMAYFDSQSQREAWFSAHSIGEFEQYSPTRPDKQSINAYASGSIHVALPYDNLTQCDYAMFKNTDIDNTRWYYVKIIHREYVNINSTRLWFEIDYYSTYSDLIDLKACFVERTHIKISDDWQGIYPSYKYLMTEPMQVNTIKEHFAKWETVISSSNQTLKPDSYFLIATRTFNNTIDFNIKYYMGAPVGTVSYTTGDQVGVHSILSSYHNNSNVSVDDVMAIYWLPSSLTVESKTPHVVQYTSTSISKNDITRSDGFPIRNAKCFCFPYVYAIASSPTANQFVIKFEEYVQSNGNIIHVYKGVGGTSAQYIYYPRLRNDYGTNEDGTGYKFLSLPPYPQLSVNSSGFNTWLSQNTNSLILQGLTGTISTVAGAGLMMVPGAQMVGGSMAVSGATKLASMAANTMDSATIPNTEVGKSTTVFSYAGGKYNVGFTLCRPSDEDITSLDDYFDVYGYTINRFMNINLKVRKNYTYVKTINADVMGKCSQDAIKSVNNMLNNGTTFWNVVNTDIGNPDAPRTNFDN